MCRLLECTSWHALLRQSTWACADVYTYIHIHICAVGSGTSGLDSNACCTVFTCFGQTPMPHVLAKPQCHIALAAYQCHCDCECHYLGGNSSADKKPFLGHVGTRTGAVTYIMNADVLPEAHYIVYIVSRLSVMAPIQPPSLPVEGMTGGLHSSPVPRLKWRNVHAAISRSEISTECAAF